MLTRAFTAFLGWIDGLELTPGGWLATFTGVVLLRCLLESYSSPSSSGILACDTPTLVHYWLSFLAILLGAVWILSRAVGRPRQAVRIALCGLVLIWLGPLLDLVFTLGAGRRISYFFHGPLSLVLDFFFFLTPLSTVTPGMRIELSVIVAFGGFYVWMQRRQIGVLLQVIFELYVLLFTLFAAPSLIYIFTHIPSGSFLASEGDVLRFLERAISASTLLGNGLHGTFLFGSPVRAFEIGFDFLMEQIYFLVACGLGLVWFRQAFPEMSAAVLRNGRPERIAFYLTLLGSGAFLAQHAGLARHLSWCDFPGVAALAVAWTGGWMFAVHVNDAADLPIDALVNPGRPLPRGAVSAEAMRQIGLVWLLVSLIGAYTAGYYPFFLNLIFTSCYYVYSAQPLRLKRVPMLSSLLIAVAALSTMLAGFFFLSSDKRWTVFPSAHTLGILAVFTLAVNVRDIKDVDGDRALGIWTLPVLFGRWGVPITAALFAASFLLVPLWILPAPIFWVPSVPAAIAAYTLAIRQPYREKWIFVLYFCFLACLLFLLHHESANPSPHPALAG